MTEAAPVIFYSYAREDEPLKAELDAHLSALRREGRIESWHDREIRPGADWAEEIDRNLDRADIVLALVSADFPGVGLLLRRRDDKGARPARAR
jgi:hypothetical protein